MLEERQSNSAVSSVVNGRPEITTFQYCLMTVILFLCVFINGLADTSRSVSYPLMKLDLDLSYTQYGMLQSMGQLTYLFGAFGIAYGMEHFGFKGPLVISFLISLIGSITTAYSHTFIGILISQFFAGCILGTLDDGPSSIAIILFTKHPAALFCIMSGIYGFGSCVGPEFAQKIYDMYPQYSYRGISLAFCVPLVLVGLFVMCSPFAIKRPIKLNSECVKDAEEGMKPEVTGSNDISNDINRNQKKKEITVMSCLTSPLLWFCSVLLCLLAVAERGTVSWGFLYVRDVLHLPEVEGTKLNSRFYFIFMISRLVCGFITDRIGPFTMEYIIIPLGMLVYVIGFLVGDKSIYVLPFVGFFVALYWPTFLMCCKQYWKEESSIPIACLLPMQSIVGMVIQFLLGVVNDHFGPQYAFWLSVPAGLLALGMLIYFHLIVRRKNEKEATTLIDHAM